MGHAANDAADEAATGQHVQLGELLGGLDRMPQGKDVADDADFHPLGTGDQGGGQNGAGRVDVEVGEVVLVDEGPVEAQLFAQLPLFQVLLISQGRQVRVAELVGLASFRSNLVRNPGVGRLVKAVELHRRSSLLNLSAKTSNALPGARGCLSL